MLTEGTRKREDIDTEGRQVISSSEASCEASCEASSKGDEGIEEGARR